MNVLNAINLLQDIAKDNPNATLVIKADGVYIPIEIQHKKISCQLGVDDSLGKEFAVIEANDRRRYNELYSRRAELSLISSMY